LCSELAGWGEEKSEKMRESYGRHRKGRVVDYQQRVGRLEKPGQPAEVKNTACKKKQRNGIVPTQTESGNTTDGGEGKIPKSKVGKNKHIPKLGRPITR